MRDSLAFSAASHRYSRNLPQTSGIEIPRRRGGGLACREFFIEKMFHESHGNVKQLAATCLPITVDAVRGDLRVQPESLLLTVERDKTAVPGFRSMKRMRRRDTSEVSRNGRADTCLTWRIEWRRDAIAVARRPKLLPKKGSNTNRDDIEQLIVYRCGRYSHGNFNRVLALIERGIVNFLVKKFYK